jgi:hypothetical protein
MVPSFKVLPAAMCSTVAMGWATPSSSTGITAPVTTTQAAVLKRSRTTHRHFQSGRILRIAQQTIAQAQGALIHRARGGTPTAQ